MGIHDEEKWECDYCGDKFNQRQSIKAHMNLKHIESKKNPCLGEPKKEESVQILQLKIREMIEYSDENSIRLVITKLIRLILELILF